MCGVSLPNPILSHLSTCCTTVLHPSLMCYRKKNFHSHLCISIRRAEFTALFQSVIIWTSNNEQPLYQQKGNLPGFEEEIQGWCRGPSENKKRADQRGARAATAPVLPLECFKEYPLTSTSGLKSNQTRWNWGYPPCQTPKNHSVKFCWNKIPVK